MLSTSTSISSVGRTRDTGEGGLRGARAEPPRQPRQALLRARGLSAKRKDGLVTGGPGTRPRAGSPFLPGAASGDAHARARRHRPARTRRPARTGTRAGRALTPVGVRALRGDGGADAVHPYPLDAQLLQLPLQVPLLSLELVYLVNGFSVTIFKFLQVRAVVVGARRPISKLPRTLHLALEPRNRAVFLRSHCVSVD